MRQSWLSMHQRLFAIAIAAVALALRILHLAYSARSPLSFQIGPDEDYYLRFARDVAFGSGGMLPEFAFMDPLYGYMLGGVLLLTDGNAFPMYAIQAILDAGTVLALMMIGHRLGRVREGLIAGLLYTLAGPSIAITMALLKETWVAFFFCGWVLIAIATVQKPSAWRWGCLGIFCGLGVLLRSNLLLLAAMSLVLPMVFAKTESSYRGVLAGFSFVVGLAGPLLAASVRNQLIEERWSPLPANGGLVLHQLYNEENPTSHSGYPSFVRYAHPSEAWRAYRVEAERRIGREMDPAEIDDYWRQQATNYIKEHPWQTLQNGFRKLADFSAWLEVPNNRSYSDDREFSPVLKIIPPPFAVLFALGLPGLVVMLRAGGRSLLIWPPVLTGIATIAVFFAEDRFRLVVVPMFAFGSAVWLVAILDAMRLARWRNAFLGMLLSAGLATWSIAWGMQMPQPTRNWQRAAAGWYKLHEFDRLRQLLEEISSGDGDKTGIDEFRGLLLLEERRPEEARSAFERALTLRKDRHEVWHNYALSLSALREYELALSAEEKAFALQPMPDYHWMMANYLGMLGRQDEANELYRRLANDPSAGHWSELARSMLAGQADRSSD